MTLSGTVVSHLVEHGLDIREGHIGRLAGADIEGRNNEDNALADARVCAAKGNACTRSKVVCHDLRSHSVQRSEVSKNGASHVVAIDGKRRARRKSHAEGGKEM
jgi:hypothetical protein